MKQILLLIFFSVFALNAFGQIERADGAAVDSVVKKIYLAKDSGGEIGETSENFSVNDVPIYCVIEIENTKPMLVKMNLVAVKVRGVKPETKVVSVSYQTTGMQDQVNFTGKPDGFWTAGTYRVDIFIDGKPVGAKDFEIQNPIKTARLTPVNVKNLTPKTKSPRRP